jgi:hypothetical protein
MSRTCSDDLIHVLNVLYELNTQKAGKTGKITGISDLCDQALALIAVYTLRSPSPVCP